MTFFKRILGALGLLLSVVGLLVSLAVGVGVWVIREPVTTRLTQIFGRVEGGLDLADRSLDYAQKSLARAATHLEEVRKEQKDLSQAPKKDSATWKLLSRKVQRKFGPELDEAHQKLQTLAEAVVVINSVLEDLGNFPDLAITGLDKGRLEEMNDRLAKVGPTAWELSQLLGEMAPGTETDDHFSRIEQALRTLREWIAEYQAKVEQVRQRTAEVKDRTLPRIIPAAILISLICLWLALSQLSIMGRAWSWLWASGGNRPGKESPTSRS
jgi:hypothetical protein